MLWIQRSGLMLIRVKGPVAVGDKLVMSPGHDYLVKESGDTTPIVGEAREANASAEVRLIQVMAPAGGGGTGGEALWA